MRIVNAMFGRGRGGLEQVFLDYCEALLAGGHEVVTLIHPDAAIRPALEQQRVAFHAIGNRNAWDPVATLRLRSWLKYTAPDATLAHGNRAINLLKLAGATPLIGVAANYTVKGGGLDAVLCPTQDLARHCRTRGFADDRISVVPHAVSAPSSPPSRDWHDPPVVGALGRFVEKKGFHVLIEALQRLHGAGVPFRAIIAGAGDEAAALKRLTQERGLDAVVTFPGWQDDTARFFAAIDIFCLPSLHEPFGIVVLEAMAQALPVIATDSEGPSEILRDGEDGMIVPKADPAALATAIERMLDDRQAARALGLEGYATVRGKYSMARLGMLLDQAVRTVAG
jgi:glycosyltransferase involved in cell wall biosynthesis